MITTARKSVWVVWAGTFLLALSAFLLAPGLDRAVSAWAYGADETFASTISGLTGIIRQWGPDTVLTLLGGVLLWAAIGRWVGLPKLLERAQAAYLALCLLLGPGLIVNAGLKSFWGRARPSQTELFGGEASFTPAWHMADQCASNCSFVSGDAALGFSLTAFAFLNPKWRQIGWMMGLSFGAIFGATRVAQGAHFLSDIVFAGLIVIGLNMAIAHVMAQPEPGHGA